jgi:hypothetical protein
MFMNLIDYVEIVIRTASGTFHDGDLLLNQKGMRLISEEKESRVY